MLRFTLLAVALAALLLPYRSTLAQDAAPGYEELLALQPKLLRITATVDGSGRIVFSPARIWYAHKSWQPPQHVMFDGEPWADLRQSPAAWRALAPHLDLSKAYIARRSGRDTIALEHTPEGFDLYLCDAPNGAAEYSVTIAIPRRR